MLYMFYVCIIHTSNLELDATNFSNRPSTSQPCYQHKLPSTLIGNNVVAICLTQNWICSDNSNPSVQASSQKTFYITLGLV